VYDHQVRSVLAFFYRRTADAWLAADLTAETFAEAFASRWRYRRMSVPAEAWIFGIARNQLRRALRRGRASSRARRRIGLERLEVDDVSLERIEDLIDLQPVKHAMDQALGTMNPGVAQALRLRIGLEMSYQDVARKLGCSEKAARVRVSRGLRQLQRVLEVGT
jgi:RNA polymerase sigma-70 factor (ECF subfamily)